MEDKQKTWNYFEGLMIVFMFLFNFSIILYSIVNNFLWYNRLGSIICVSTVNQTILKPCRTFLCSNSLYMWLQEMVSKSLQLTTMYLRAPMWFTWILPLCIFLYLVVLFKIGFPSNGLNELWKTFPQCPILINGIL